MNTLKTYVILVLFLFGLFLIVGCNRPEAPTASEGIPTSATKVSSQAVVTNCVPPPSGLVSWWPGDGNAKDIVGGNDGTLVNGATFAPGLVGQAFSLDGIDDVVALGNNNIIGTGNAPFTVVAWMFPTKIPTGLYYFLIRLRQDAQFFVGFVEDHFGVPGGLVGAVFRGEAHQWLTPIDHSTLVNQWTHVAVIYNGGNKSSELSFAIFFNGVQLPIGTVDLGPVGGNCNDNAIGSDTLSECVGDFAHFQGLIDEICIYNRVLSSDEIFAIFNAGSAGKCKFISVDIDIKPGNDANCFNNNGNGVIPVAILGGANFDATQIDPETVELEGTAVKAVGKSNKLLAHIEDVNNDGFDDLVVQIEDVDGTFTEGTTTATISGQLFDGTPFEGTDEICIVP